MLATCIQSAANSTHAIDHHMCIQLYMNYLERDSLLFFSLGGRAKKRKYYTCNHLGLNIRGGSSISGLSGIERPSLKLISARPLGGRAIEEGIIILAIILGLNIRGGSSISGLSGIERPSLKLISARPLGGRAIEVEKEVLYLQSF